MQLMLRHAILSCALLAASGCYWPQHPVQEPNPISRHSPVRIWSGDSVETWHAVRVTKDSIFGIPYRMSLKCYTCARSMSLTQVDSMKIRSQSAFVKRAEFVGAVAAVLVVEVGVCRIVAPHDRQC